MADQFWRTQVTLENDSLLPVNSAVNTFHWRVDDSEADGGGHDDIVSRLQTFYQAIDANLSSELTGDATVKTYDLNEPEPRAPLFEDVLTFTPGTDSLPNEVALCLSYRAVAVSGVKAARRRGRIFLGPLSVSSMAGDVGDMLAGQSNRQTILDAAVAMGQGATVALPRLSVFSRASFADSGEYSESFFTVATFFIDNRFDTQRRRGLKPSARLTATVLP